MRALAAPPTLPPPLPPQLASLLALLLLAGVAAPAPLPPPAAPPAGLLVLRAACAHPAAFSDARLRSHAAAAGRAAPLARYRLLSYEVVVACASPAVRLALRSIRTAVVLLRVATADDASPMSDITLDVERSPYIRNYVGISESASSDVGDASSGDSLFHKSKLRTSAITSPNASRNPSDDVTVLAAALDLDDDATDEGTQRDRPPRLLLSDVPLERRPQPPAVEDAYDELLEAVEREAAARLTGVDTARGQFYLYEQLDDDDEDAWRPVAAFETLATRRLDDDEDWHVVATVGNASDAWRRWAARAEPDEAHAGGAWLWGSVGAAGCAAVLCAAAGAARARHHRRRGRRRRGDVVLAAADFTFPAEEPRRVPDGMETMLSCWLQQLHEFGGPELERPDLLKQPAPPSAPSSTASGSRLALDRRTRYKGDAVHLKPLNLGFGVTTLELRCKSTDVLLVLHGLRHENLNPFIGCLCETRPALVWDHCGRGSLEDVLMADDIKLDWTFRLSLLTDLVKGLRYLHASPLRVHGRLSSRNCCVDSRWVLRLTDHGLADFWRAQGLAPPPRAARDLLWTAPELLRAGAAARGTQPGDVFSFAIIMQEVIVRGEPYCMLALTPGEIIEKLCRPPPLIRPSVSMGAAPPEAVSLMRQCWAEPPDMRPDCDALIDIFRLLHRGRKINIVDSMFEMLEKYSNNLEELIKERTEQLDMEKKKTEQLLNRMLPRSVAERLVLGLRVEPEEFEEVSIYFSDIVGFTALAARSTPVQVVALLNDLYTTFDAAIERYNVYKVETIGDAYMVVGGLPVRARDHAEAVATMALHLLHLAGAFRIRHLPSTPLHLRIGLHSGPCCAAVVGLTMPRYCLFGDTVNTASRMESTGAAWRIQVSAATAARLEAAGGYRLRSRGLTQIKGKGVMHTYWLLGKDGFEKPLPTPPPLPSEEALLEHEAEGDAESEAEPVPAPASPPETVPEPCAAPLHNKYAWQRSGAVSADSSPPAAPYSRYRYTPRALTRRSRRPLGRLSRLTLSLRRCLGGGGGGRVLRRQWSLERGEALAAARAASPDPPGAPAPPAPPARPPRYRTRPDPDAAASFD
ncbi:retinal guanylyl cyclase 1 [Pectinophora gossypiella]|uniref:retinal guanylyl cyclase 1 n=1 Tax=Pectinophora gossypiella TaxID=13191 RepID=UPI00214DFAD2|nr:retinal guanylyl cyclase 1 [Pectinophora gossypiella]